MLSREPHFVVITLFCPFADDIYIVIYYIYIYCLLFIDLFIESRRTFDYFALCFFKNMF
jgi:hypothetical protein